jgi:hypothetical protein
VCARCQRGAASLHLLLLSRQAEPTACPVRLSTAPVGRPRPYRFLFVGGPYVKRETARPGRVSSRCYQLVDEVSFFGARAQIVPGSCLGRSIPCRNVGRASLLASGPSSRSIGSGAIHLLAQLEQFGDRGPPDLEALNRSAGRREVRAACRSDSSARRSVRRDRGSRRSPSAAGFRHGPG